MLAQEGRDFEAVLLWRRGRLATVWIKVATCTLDRRCDPRSPCAASFKGTARGRIIGCGLDGFILGRSLGLAQVEPDIGCQFLEQRARIVRLCVVTFLRLL